MKNTAAPIRQIKPIFSDQKARVAAIPAPINGNNGMAQHAPHNTTPKMPSRLAFRIFFFSQLELIYTSEFRISGQITDSDTNRLKIGADSKAKKNRNFSLRFAFEALSLQSMLISELAQKTGVSTDTIRYYEKIGILKKEEIGRRKNNYREYSATDLEILRRTKQLKSLGMSLDAVAGLTTGWSGSEPSCGPLRQALVEKLPELKDAMRLIRDRITEIETTLEKCSDTCTIESVTPSCLGC